MGAAMNWIWVLSSLALVSAVVLLARRVHRADDSRVRLDARVAAVLEGPQTGLAVWDRAGRLVGVNRRFKEFYPDAPLKPGVVFEDLTRYTANRGLFEVGVTDRDDIEHWVAERVQRFGQPTHEVLRTADRRWIDVHSRTSDAGEVLLLYTDTTDAREAEATLSERSDRLARRALDVELVADVVAAVAGADTAESVARQVLELVCAWSDWPVGCAYRVPTTDGARSSESVLAWHEADGAAETFAGLRRLSERQPVRAGEGIAGRALQARRVVWIPNLSVDPAVDSARRELMTGIRAACAVPVVQDQEGDQDTPVLVVFEFLSREQLAPDPLAARVLETVAEVVGLSLSPRYRIRLS